MFYQRLMRSFHLRHVSSRQHIQHAPARQAQQSSAPALLLLQAQLPCPQLLQPGWQGLLQGSWYGSLYWLLQGFPQGAAPPWYGPLLQGPLLQPQPPSFCVNQSLRILPDRTDSSDLKYYIVSQNHVPFVCSDQRCGEVDLGKWYMLGLINHHLIKMNIARKFILGSFAAGFALAESEEKESCFIYRDDIGAFWGIKGYEEQVTEVGSHHGHLSWPQFRAWGAYDSGSVRRGFQVFTRNCANCHGMIGKKYDLLLDKVYEQLELSTWVAEHFTIHPAHHHYKQFYYQEWDERDRYIHDHIYAPYFSQDQAKNANGGVWPTDFTKIRMRPGGINYIYNIMTGYHFKAPYGMEVPKGKYFNPYFDHMIIGMPRQLHDGMLEYEDGTPASTPQMANDVANFIFFMQRRSGWRRNDKKVRQTMVLFGILMLFPLKYLKTQGYFRSLLCTRTEAYAVRDNLGYKHWKTGMRSIKALHYRGAYWT